MKLENDGLKLDKSEQRLIRKAMALAALCKSVDQTLSTVDAVAVRMDEDGRIKKHVNP